MNRIKFFAAAAALMFCGALQAKVTLPSVISDNMVLQQNSQAALWGTARPGAKVTVVTSWDKAKATAVADAADGRWSLTVATPAAGGPYEITVSDGEKLTLRNVLIGEVWIASGQSNMEMAVAGYTSQPVKGGAEAAMSSRASRQIRICNVAHQSSTTLCDNTQGSWEACSPATVFGTSATAWFFADALEKALDVPVGIVACSWGGSTMQTWMSYDLLKADFPEIDLGSVEGTHPVKVESQDACLLYNGMLAPIAPYTCRGFLWYQGESDHENPELYIRMQTAFAGMLRTLFKVPDAPFYYVQIAPYSYSAPDSFLGGYFYEAQQKCLQTIPHSGMVTTCDIGEENVIHPSHKKEVGQRLAYLALGHDYGFDFLCPDAPTYSSVTFENGRAHVFFNVDERQLSPLGVPLEGFEIAGADRVFHKAEAAVDLARNSSVIVFSSEVPEPVAVRYCFRNWCRGNLYNSCGMAAAPFRTDDWNL